ncbi:MAG: hypothetical protein V5804_17090 [Mucilaginibacter sp.]|uniref:hypothetical protein n=1 Tax=Mucilaginibacter sp. TaxID=1882438 RepID=UPI0034E3F895
MIHIIIKGTKKNADKKSNNIKIKINTTGKQNSVVKKNGFLVKKIKLKTDKCDIINIIQANSLSALIDPALIIDIGAKNSLLNNPHQPRLVGIAIIKDNNINNKSKAFITY